MMEVVGVIIYKKKVVAIANKTMHWKCKKAAREWGVLEGGGCRESIRCDVEKIASLNGRADIGQ
jgi:hypothetical protein